MTGPAERLRQMIRDEGPIPFARFMEEALYGEGGYYRRDPPPIGAAGDYVTGSTLSPLFGRATARLLRRLDTALGKPADLLEAGCGSGEHLAAVVAALAAEGGRAAERRLLGWDRIRRPLPAGVGRLEGLEDLPAGAIEGLVFSYELFDALPVHRLIGRPGAGPGELAVALGEDGELVWREREVSDPEVVALAAATGVELLPGQIADLGPGWEPLYRSLARRLGRGLMVTCDYGFGSSRLLDPRIRFHGTLACYTRHRVHRDPFVRVGEQDLTAHVDLSLLARAGEAEGLETVACSRQALWLVACGVFEDLATAGPEERGEAMSLLDGEGMGEEIRVLVQARGVVAGALLDRGLLRAEATARIPAPSRPAERQGDRTGSASSW